MDKVTVFLGSSFFSFSFFHYCLSVFFKGFYLSKKYCINRNENSVPSFE